MNIKATLEAVHLLHEEGVIGKFAVGGAVAASFYEVEPAETRDVDIFVGLQPAEGQFLISLTPVYEALRAKGYEIRNEFVVIEGWPVQFLPPDSPLVEEAIEQAVGQNVDGLSVPVFSAEHLVAIALKLGRPKDKLRVVQFLQANALNPGHFRDLLERHGLTEVWETFKKFLSD